MKSQAFGRAALLIPLCILGLMFALGGQAGDPGMPFEMTTGTAVSSTTTTVTSLVLGGRAQMLVFEVSVAGTLTLNGFKVQCRDHSTGSWYDYLSGTDFDSATNANMLFATDTGPHEVGYATSGGAHAHIRVNGVEAVCFGAVTAAGTVTVYVRGLAY